MKRRPCALGATVAVWCVLGISIAEATSLRIKNAGEIHLRGGGGGGVQRSASVENPLSKISNGANKALGETAHQADEQIKKPVMGGISRFRLLMCLGRPNVLEHKKCLTFFEKKCPAKTTTEGTCQKFLQMIHDKCQAGEMKACVQMERMEAIANDEDPDEAEARAAEVHGKQAKGEVVAEDYGTEELESQELEEGDYEEDESDYEGTDSDGDGVLDKKDAFPHDPSETKDTDGDGIGDNKDPHPTDPTRWGQKEGDKKKKKKNKGTQGDSDGDGVPDEKDAFPDDPEESKDSDGDGVGDNSDAFPHDASETKDSDGDGVGDNKDAFPHDPKEQKDSDGDGVGDNADGFPNDPKKWRKDTDGDGVEDHLEVYPNDPTKKVLKDDIDSDGDGVKDSKDAFPHDPTETKDSDGDGTGDNSDSYPNDARCSHHGGFRNCGGGNATNSSGGGGNATGNATGAPKNLDKTITKLPEDGYNEYTRSKVLHEDIKTMTGDWIKERPATDETETDATLRHCQKTPNTEYCKLYLRKYG